MHFSLLVAAHAKLFIIFLLLSFFFSKPSTKMADVGKLLWAQTSYIVFVWVQVYLWLPENIVACEFHRHWGFVYIVKCHLVSLHLFQLCLHSCLYIYDNSFVPFAAACLSVELASWAFCLIDQVLTAIDFVEYNLPLYSCTQKWLTCYGYVHAGWLL